MRALETKNENFQAVQAFRKRLEEIAFSFEEVEWGFPNGERAIYPTYSMNTHLGVIQVGVPKSWITRIPHLIRFKKEQGPPSPDVEINIPLEHDRRISGLYVKSDSDYWLCSRGSFTSYRGQIKREFTLSHFNKWLIQIDDMAKPVSVIPVCSLASTTLADEIATFVLAVQELKALHKSGEKLSETISSGRLHNATTVWGDGVEFEGSKNSSGVASEYEYLHGPLCNQLAKFLKVATASNQSVFVSKNAHADVAIVDGVSQKAHIIFEVKTSALPSSQIYTAVGQLHYYKYLYGHAMTQLYLVLPLSCKSNETEIFVKSIGITVVYGESGEFQTANGSNLVIEQ